MKTKKIQVAIADDHVLFTDSLASFINSSHDITVCNTSQNGQELMNYLKRRSFPDVILMDIEMPGKDGFETAKEIIEKYKHAKIIVLSMHSGRAYMKRMLAAGVSGYLLKDTAGHTLLNAIRKVADGGLAYNEEALNIMRLMVSNEDGFNLDLVEFSERELQIIKCFCEEMSVTEVSKFLNVSKSAVERNKRAICEKTGVKSTAGIIVYAVKNKLFYC
jgi:DNA-binding NarL/FixJ family response regulator